MKAVHIITSFCFGDSNNLDPVVLSFQPAALEQILHRALEARKVKSNLFLTLPSDQFLVSLLVGSEDDTYERYLDKAEDGEMFFAKLETLDGLVLVDAGKQVSLYDLSVSAGRVVQKAYAGNSGQYEYETPTIPFEHLGIRLPVALRHLDVTKIARVMVQPEQDEWTQALGTFLQQVQQYGSLEDQTSAVGAFEETLYRFLQEVK